jgi:hypothetical protein
MKFTVLLLDIKKKNQLFHKKNISNDYAEGDKLE